MDPSILALFERCAPGSPAGPLAAIVREASGFEPLLITLRRREPIRIRPSTREEAIETATQALLAGDHIELGITQIDGASLSAFGLTVSSAFDACQHVRAVAVRLKQGSPKAPTGGQDVEGVSTVAAAPSRNLGRPRGPATPGIDQVQQPSSQPARSGGDPPVPWDVYRTASRSTVFVFGR